ncbi:MAG: tetratricopeptide repeat protein [Candidatus Neomarinimicrobiota bacterium]|nr:tetratricopeptide repeat protein [Candidatus Neomarinimicrobiota bacterium]
MNKKKSSIFFSDIVGYSSLFSANEVLALSLLEEHNIILEKIISKHNGKIIKNIGDAIFAEFNKTLDAINSGIEIQKQLEKRNNIATNDNKIKVRIGLHYGEVYVNNNDLFGNNVNICNRIESLAFPGSIACSEDFILQLGSMKIFKREYGFISLKNIKKPIKIFKIYNNQKHYLSETTDDILKFLMKMGISPLKNDKVEKKFISIGFLYPKNLGDIYTIDKSIDNDFLSIEINKQIIDYANKLSIIRTPSFETIINYKERDLQDIAFELSLEYLLQSTIMKDNDSFKIYFSLFSINSAENIYEKSFEGKFHDMKKMVGALLIDLSNLFNFKISDEQLKVFQADLNIDNEAYKFFLEGKHLSQKNSSPDSLEKSKFKLKQSIGIDDQFAEAYTALGATYYSLGENEEAEECYDEAEEIIQECENLETLSIVYNNLGIYYRNQHKIKKSIRYFEKAIKSIKKLNDRAQLANIYNNISTAHSILKENDLALNLLSRSELIYKELEEKDSLGNCYATMGNIYKNKDKYKEAIKYYNLAKPIFLSENMVGARAQLLILQAQCYLDINEINNTKENLDEAYEIVNNFNMPMHKGRYYFLMAQVNIHENKFENSLDLIDEAIDIFEEIGQKIRLAESLLLKIRILSNLDKIDKTYKIYKKANRIIKKLNDDKLSNQLQLISNLINI